MIKAKTMTHWENENYDYPLPDVSHFSKKEAKKLKIRMSINTYPAAIFVRRCKKMQPTDLTVAGCGVCMMLPGTILPPGMGPRLMFVAGGTGIPPDGLQFLQGRQSVAVFEFVMPAYPQPV